MALQSAQSEILDTLTDLDDANLDMFRFKLRDPSVEPRIRKGEVDGRSRVQITELLLSRCGETGALRRTLRALRGMGCKREAEELESRNASRLNVRTQTQMFPVTETMEVSSAEENEPTAESLSVRPNGTTKRPQSILKERPRAERPRAERPRAERPRAERPKAKKPELSGQLLLFGKHKGQSFQWLLQNHVDYAVYVVGTHLEERDGGDTTQSRLMRNKDALVEYLRLFPDVMEEVHFYREGLAPLGFGKYKNLTRLELYNSKDEEEKRYVNWLRSMKYQGEGVQMEAVLKYIFHRDGKSGTRFGPSLKKQRI